MLWISFCGCLHCSFSTFRSDTSTSRALRIPLAIPDPGIVLTETKEQAILFRCYLGYGKQLKKVATDTLISHTYLHGNSFRVWWDSSLVCNFYFKIFSVPKLQPGPALDSYRLPGYARLFKAERCHWLTDINYKILSNVRRLLSASCLNESSCSNIHNNYCQNFTFLLRIQGGMFAATQEKKAERNVGLSE